LTLQTNRTAAAAAAEKKKFKQAAGRQAEDSARAVAPL